MTRSVLAFFLGVRAPTFQDAGPKHNQLAGELSVEQG